MEPHGQRAEHLSDRLRAYRQLLLREQQLQARLRSLEREYAREGPLAAPARLELELADQRDKLAQLQKDILQLEESLERERRWYVAAEARKARREELEGRRQRIANLEAEIAHKHEQARIYEGRIRYLEAQKALFGIEAPISLLNDISETRRQLAQVRGEIEAREQLRQQLTGQHPPAAHVLNQPSRPDTWAGQGQPIHLAANLTPKLQHYRDLQRSEKQLGELVYLLTRKYALYGPLYAPEHLARDLAEESARLDQLRRDIADLEQDLAQEWQAYALAEAAQAQEQDLANRRRRIVDIVIELRRKRELARIYQENIRYLEEQRAQLGLDTPLRLVNEIGLVSRLSEDIAREIKAQESSIEQEFGISREQLTDIALLSDQEVVRLAQALLPQRSLSPSMKHGSRVEQPKTAGASLPANERLRFGQRRPRPPAIHLNRLAGRHEAQAAVASVQKRLRPPKRARKKIVRRRRRAQA